MWRVAESCQPITTWWAGSDGRVCSETGLAISNGEWAWSENVWLPPLQKFFQNFPKFLIVGGGYLSWWNPKDLLAVREPIKLKKKEAFHTWLASGTLHLVERFPKIKHYCPQQGWGNANHNWRYWWRLWGGSSILESYKWLEVVKDCSGEEGVDFRQSSLFITRVNRELWVVGG